jgi:anti-sigma-K factor RskA
MSERPHESPRKPNLPIRLADANSGSERHPDPSDIALYAMQLLSGDEAAAIAHHLEHCGQCREELARTLSDLAATALTVDMEAVPAGARKRLLQQVAREKKVVSIPQTQPQPQLQPQPQPIAAFGRSRSMFGADEPQPRPAARTSVLAWAGWPIAAALAVAVGLQYKDRQALTTTVGLENGQILRLDAAAAASHELLDALTDPKAVRVNLATKPEPKSGPVGGVTYNPAKGTLVFLASDLDPLQPSKAYELWVIPQDGSAPVPAGTFHPDDQGNASLIMPDLPKGVAAKAFGVTIEDDGGSQTPTMPILMAGS